jgi:hypothetical protein
MTEQGMLLTFCLALPVLSVVIGLLRLRAYYRQIASKKTTH